MSFAKNYIVNYKEWKPLSDIMNADYDHTKGYFLYVNDIAIGHLSYTLRTTTPDIKDLGRDIQKFSEIEILPDSGDDVYIRTLFGNINIEIREKV